MFNKILAGCILSKMEGFWPRRLRDISPGILFLPSDGGSRGMQGKVEICGINTAKLEVLKNE